MTLAREAAGLNARMPAIHYNVPLITHNRTDYLGVPELKIISHS